MKKVRITIKKGSAGKRFPIFQSPEALYVWKYDSEMWDSFKLDPALGSIVTLRPGETMEVEWMGFEYIHDGDVTLRIDQVRLAKTIKIRANSTSKVVGIHSGWITDDIISFKSGDDDSVKRTRLTNKSKHKFNIEELFASRDPYEKEQSLPVLPEDLH